MDIRCPCDSNLRQIPITVQLSVKTRGTQSQAKPPPNFFGVRTSKKSVPLRIKMFPCPVIITKKAIPTLSLSKIANNITTKLFLNSAML